LPCGIPINLKKKIPVSKMQNIQNLNIDYDEESIKIKIDNKENIQTIKSQSLTRDLSN